MFTCRDGKGGKLSSQASKMLYKLPGAVYIASYKEPLDQSDCWKFFVQLWNYTKLRYKESCPKCKIPYMHLPQSCQYTSCFKQYTWCILTSILRYKESCHKCIRSWYFLGQPWNILIIIWTLYILPHPYICLIPIDILTVYGLRKGPYTVHFMQCRNYQGFVAARSKIWP